MSMGPGWIAALLTLAILVAYEAGTTLLQRLRPGTLARSAHAALRAEWFAAVSAQKGGELLAVQTLRNSLMSATMLASTTALALMGTVSLAGPTLHARLQGGLTPGLLMELVLLGLLLTSLASSVMAVRFFTHASYVGGMPADAPARGRWSLAGEGHVRRAGVLYSIALRYLVLVVPVIAAIFWPWGGPIAAAAVVGTLLSLDRVERR